MTDVQSITLNVHSISNAVCISEPMSYVGHCYLHYSVLFDVKCASGKVRRLK